jgi:hypothetical protein
MSDAENRTMLLELLSAHSDGRLSDAERERLVELLRASREARRLLIEHAFLESMLANEAQGESFARQMLARSGYATESTDALSRLRANESGPLGGSTRAANRPSSTFPLLGLLRTVRKRVRRYRGDTRYALALVWLFSILFAGLVAGVVAVFTAMFRDANPPGGQQIAHEGPAQPPAQPSPVARLASVIDCVWSSETTSPKVGDDLMAGRKLLLKTGLAEVVFRSGAHAIVEGPAVFEVCSGTAGRLTRGKCTVTVEDPLARGFEIRTQGMTYTDLGTEFGTLVTPNGEQEMHVFRGRVQAEQSTQQGPGSKGQGATGSGSRVPTPRSTPLVVSAHQGIRVAASNVSGKPGKPIELIAADEKQFVRREQMAMIAAQPPEFRRWKQFSNKVCKRPDLVAYYDFQADESDRTILRNRAASGPMLDGRIEGAKWADGHFPGKQSLAFSGRDDRVRVNIPGKFETFTAVVWLRVDGLPHEHNGILMSDGYYRRVGQGHWQMQSDGVAFLGTCLSANPDVDTSLENTRGTPKLGQADLQTWRHLAIVYDSKAQIATAYFDGLASDGGKLSHPVPLDFGSSEIGNWEPYQNNMGDTYNQRWFIGRIGEMQLFNRALSAAEIKELYEGGKGVKQN